MSRRDDRGQPAEREGRIRRGYGRRITARPRAARRAFPRPAVIVVFPAADGNWSVGQEGAPRSAASCFASKLGAMRIAVRLAKSRRPSEVKILDRGGEIRESRFFERRAGDGPAAR